MLLLVWVAVCRGGFFWWLPTATATATATGPSLIQLEGEDGFSQQPQPEELRAPEGRGIPKETPARRPPVPRAIAVMRAHESALRALLVPQVLQDSHRLDLLLVRGRHTERQHLRWQTPVWANTATDQLTFAFSSKVKENELFMRIVVGFNFNGLINGRLCAGRRGTNVTVMVVA